MPAPFAARGRAQVEDWLKDQIYDNLGFAFENGMDKPEIMNWRWPY